MNYELQRRRLAMLDCPASLLATLIGTSNGNLSKYFGGGSAGFTHETVTKIDHVLVQLENLTQLAYLLPLNYSANGRIKECLDGLADSSLTITVTKYEPRKRAAAFSVRLRNGRWFGGVKNNEIIAGLNFMGCTAMTADMADAVLARLADAGQDGCSRVENAFAVHVETEIEKVWPGATQPAEEVK